MNRTQPATATTAAQRGHSAATISWPIAEIPIVLLTPYDRSVHRVLPERASRVLITALLVWTSPKT